MEFVALFPLIFVMSVYAFAIRGHERTMLNRKFAFFENKCKFEIWVVTFLECFVKKKITIYLMLFVKEENNF